MNWIVYILECADATLYTGIAKNLARRIDEHESGKGAKYTKGRGPLKLIYQEEHSSRSAALKREAYIKSLDRSSKFALIRSNRT